jgi:hypothetical protein
MLRIGLAGSLAVSTIGTALLVQANVPFAVAVLILSGFFDFTDPSSHAALR